MIQIKSLLLRLEHTTACCRNLAGPPDLPADVRGLVVDDQLRLYEHLERLASASRDATHRLAGHLHHVRRGSAPPRVQPWTLYSQAELDKLLPAPTNLHPGFEAAVLDLFRPGQAARETAALARLNAERQQDCEPVDPHCSCGAACTEADWRGSSYYCDACWAKIEPARRAWEERSQRGKN